MDQLSNGVYYITSHCSRTFCTKGWADACGSEKSLRPDAACLGSLLKQYNFTVWSQLNTACCPGLDPERESETNEKISLVPNKEPVLVS